MSSFRDLLLQQAGAVAPPTSPGHHVQQQGSSETTPMAPWEATEQQISTQQKDPKPHFQEKLRDRENIPTLRTHTERPEQLRLQSERDSHSAEMWGAGQGGPAGTQTLPRGGRHPPSQLPEETERAGETLQQRESERLRQLQGPQSQNTTPVTLCQ